MARLLVKNGFGRSLGNMINALFGGANEDRIWLEVTKEAEGIYAVFCPHSDEALGFVELDDEVQCIDRGDAPILGISERVQWQDVVVTPTRIYAPSMNRIRKAFTHFKVCFWDPNDL